MDIRQWTVRLRLQGEVTEFHTEPMTMADLAVRVDGADLVAIVPGPVIVDAPAAAGSDAAKGSDTIEVDKQ